MRLAALRKSHPTRLYAAPVPPANELEVVYNDAPLGKNVAYVTLETEDETPDAGKEPPPGPND